MQTHTYTNRQSQRYKKTKNHTHTYPIYIFICTFIYPTFSHSLDAIQGHFFLAEFNRYEFRYAFPLIACHTKVKKPILPNYLFTAGRRIVWFITFSLVISICEMQTALFGFWTRVTKSISNDNIHYVTSAIYIYIFKNVQKRRNSLIL